MRIQPRITNRPNFPTNMYDLYDLFISVFVFVLCLVLPRMLVDDIGDVTITNDGATILKQLEVEHPAAKGYGTVRFGSSRRAEENGRENERRALASTHIASYHPFLLLLFSELAITVVRTACLVVCYN